jgi:hypothetical protein
MRMLLPLLLVLWLLGCNQGQKGTMLRAGGEKKALVTFEPVEGGDAIIQTGGWGFSVYDPTGEQVQYFTSKGSFLGIKKVEQGGML